MNYILFIIIGLAGGILGGLGMGGGTLLIPLLVTFVGVSQHGAQMINLVAFIPMAIVALIIHFKNGLVKPKYILIISLPAIVFAIGASFLAFNTHPENLKRYFGIFLIVLGVYQLISLIIKSIINPSSPIFKIKPFSKRDLEKT